MAKFTINFKAASYQVILVTNDIFDKLNIGALLTYLVFMLIFAEIFLV